MIVRVSVPGKVFVMGEHAVVYGKPALLAAINRRLTVTVSPGNNDSSGYVAQIIGIVEDHFKKAFAAHVAITSDIPVGYHLGSSAAVAVGVIAAASYYVTNAWDLKLVNSLAFEAEKIAHGTPSGADNTTVTYGGFIRFPEGPLSLHTTLTHFYLIDTGKPEESTKDMVAYVAAHKHQHLFDENEKQTGRVLAALETNDEALLIDAIRSGEATLEAMGVVSEKAKSIIRTIEQSGGAAKILGGGGRKAGVGYLLCYTRKPEKDFIPITLGEEGVRRER